MVRCEQRLRLRGATGWRQRCPGPCHHPETRRLPCHRRGRAHRARGGCQGAWSPGHAGAFDRHLRGAPSGRDADAAHQCDGDADERAGAHGGEVVQPPARLRFRLGRRGRARHLRPYGDAAPLRHRRADSGADRAGALWAWTEGADGGRDPVRAGRAAQFALRKTLSERAPSGAFFVVLQVAAETDLGNSRHLL
nr:hypothetical protein BOSE7B_40035 [Bosea sp. 7B]